ncbi:MAG: GntR family transcriptional regulator, partial [Hyphomonadaceae bacterium]
MSAPNSLYRRLADDLRKAIASGHYPTGSLLPTESDLCATHQVSRHTARDALRILTDEGLIERRRGAGSVVIAAKPIGPFSQGWGEIGDILQYARDTR